MKKQYQAFVAVALILCVVAWVALKRSTYVPRNEQLVNASQKQPSLGGTNLAVSIGGQGDTPQSLDSLFASTIDPAYARLRYERMKTDATFDWKQPIDFYGRVVDESNVPVSGATASFGWNDLSEKGTSHATAISDADGRFSLEGRQGKRLYVNVSKEGYYSGGDSRNATFEYANPFDGLFRPNSSLPVTFHLRAKGTGVVLITSQSGIADDFQIHVPRDGTPVNVDFMQRQAGGSGQMAVSESKPEYSNWKQATNWSFRIEIPDGGFIVSTDEFQFTAPEQGYQPVVQYDFQQGQPGWALDFKTDFYIKFGNPPRYGRLQVQTGVSYGGAILVYAINPTGSRNLEPVQ